MTTTARKLARSRHKPVICSAPRPVPRVHPRWGMSRRRKLLGLDTTPRPCGRRVPRKSRTQLYCSRRCRRRAAYHGRCL
jgi:hypothetical protein